MIDEVHVEIRKSNKLMEEIIQFDAVPPPKDLPTFERQWFDYLKLPDGTIYQGQIRDGMKDGIGAITTDDNQELVFGFWRNGRAFAKKRVIKIENHNWF